MHDVSNTDGCFGYGEIAGEVGDFTTPTTGKISNQRLIYRANTVPITRVLKYYRVKIDPIYHKCICPFKSHKGGRENTPSFELYEQTNSFFCHGCKVGGKACEFISEMEGINKLESASKVFSLFEAEIDDFADVSDIQDSSEQLSIMMDFSNTIKDFRKKYLDKKSQDFIEKRCEIYDGLNLKHKMTNETLLSVVEHLKEQISYYKALMSETKTEIIE